MRGTLIFAPFQLVREASHAAAVVDGERRRRVRVQLTAPGLQDIERKLRGVVDDEDDVVTRGGHHRAVQAGCAVLLKNCANRSERKMARWFLLYEKKKESKRNKKGIFLPSRGSANEYAPRGLFRGLAARLGARTERSEVPRTRTERSEVPSD